MTCHDWIRRYSSALAAVILVAGIAPRAHAQETPAVGAAPETPAAKEPEAAAPKPKKRRVVHKPKPAEAKPAETKSAETKSVETKSPTVRTAESKPAVPSPSNTRSTAVAPAQNPNAAPPAAVAAAIPATAAKPPEPIDFASQLDKAGATACRGQVNALATSTMGSVVKFNTMSNWSQVGGDKRAVSVAIGQKYADGSVVPFSVAQVISAPNNQGSCDGFTVQVFPSPLSCGKLRDTLAAAHGQQIGDLAGIPLMQDATGRTMLVPTAANTCVLVATRTSYAK